MGLCSNFDPTVSVSAKFVSPKEKKKEREGGGPRNYTIPRWHVFFAIKNLFLNFQELTRIVLANSNVNISHKDAYHLCNKNDITLDDIFCLIQDTVSCIERRADLQFMAFRRIMLMSLDMICMLGNSLHLFLKSYLVLNIMYPFSC